MRQPMRGPPIGVPQGQALAEGLFVHLGHADAGRFQIRHLVADRQCDLPAHGCARHVVTHERPLQHRHRTGEHALHWPLRP